MHSACHGLRAPARAIGFFLGYIKLLLPGRCIRFSLRLTLRESPNKHHCLCISRLSRSLSRSICCRSRLLDQDRPSCSFVR